MIKVTNANANLISPHAMKIGQVGIIRDWTTSQYIGKIVVKTPNDALCEVDFERTIVNHYWPNTTKLVDVNLYAIEPLPAYTKLEITLGKNE